MKHIWLSPLFGLISFIFLGLLQTPLHAMNVAGVTFAERICVDHSQPLYLIGAGTRRKAFVDVYAAALYLEQPTHDLSMIFALDVRKRIVLHFIYDEVSKEKLIEGWQDGFRLNHSRQEFDALTERFEHSSQMFRNMRAGDTIYLDYLPGIGTRILINHEQAGTIPGQDFYQAVLRVWLGEHPTQAALKQDLLGLSQ